MDPYKLTDWTLFQKKSILSFIISPSPNDFWNIFYHHPGPRFQFDNSVSSSMIHYWSIIECKFGCKNYLKTLKNNQTEIVVVFFFFHICSCLCLFVCVCLHWFICDYRTMKKNDTIFKSKVSPLLCNKCWFGWLLLMDVFVVVFDTLI